MKAPDSYLVHADASGALEVTPESAGWGFSGLRVLSLAPGEEITVGTGTSEHVVVPLAGGVEVRFAGGAFTLAGRPSVFAGPSDVAYLPRDTTYTLTSPGGGRFALCAARCERQLAPAYVAAGDVPVELRGAGQASRQVHNFGVPGVLDAERIIACEVLTPGGNWSSWPPHKHDVDRPDDHGGGESQLEEIYYYEVRDGARGPGGTGVGYQRVYGHQDADIDVQAEVRTGDVVLIPFGWHGPSMAAPGYDLYYLNVMAGPGQRRWLICDDPDHAWVRDTWADQDVDPRLPFAQAEAGLR